MLRDQHDRVARAEHCASKGLRSAVRVRVVGLVENAVFQRRGSLHEAVGGHTWRCTAGADLDDDREPGRQCVARAAGQRVRRFSAAVPVQAYDRAVARPQYREYRRADGAGPAAQHVQRRRHLDPAVSFSIASESRRLQARIEDAHSVEWALHPHIDREVVTC